MWGSPAHPLGQRHTGLWEVVSQSPLLPQGLCTMHGSRHWFSMQALLSGQSMSCWHSPLWTKNENYMVKRLFILARLSLNLTRNTSAVWISCKSWWTFTVGPMVVYSALGTSSTWIINAAGVNTSSISAGLTGGTFIITWAANLNWGNYKEEWFYNKFNFLMLN